MGLSHSVKCPLCFEGIRSIVEVSKSETPSKEDVDKLDRIMLALHICKDAKINDTIKSQQKKIEELKTQYDNCKKDGFRQAEWWNRDKESLTAYRELVEKVKASIYNSHNCLDRPFGEVDIGFGRQYAKQALQAIEDFEEGLGNEN